ncbi:MAG TPA: cytochrome b N-terminal domain-containing protein [Mycobacteriales bacterium]|nr:cytochrome b N-terminal domain-containing protein [Mycobacteriales bacterium]
MRLVMAHLPVSVIDLNGPGRYFKWSVLIISAANLGVILAILLIFLLALALRFPGSRRAVLEPAAEPDAPPPPTAPSTTRSWTGRLRALGMRWLPPERLLPEEQPSYVSSWIYVFGVATLAALAVAIVSGFAIAIGGPDWWQTNPVGHFFNSCHLWSVELFFAFMVIHLWGKFFMAAWRGKRARTWITGVLAFLASIVEAFTGYLSQQNFDSQWISTNGKDALNAAGVGGFFNVMNFGQMLLWHVVLMPLILVAVVGVHILLVRHRGVVHPIPARRGRDPLGARMAATTDTVTRTRAERREARRVEAAEWRGPKRRYDIIKEGAAATLIAVLATVALAGLLSSPDAPSITIKRWATADPTDFVGTVAAELAGTSETATYGPPYNHGDAFAQRIGVSWQTLVGVVIPISPAQAFVLGPLGSLAPDDPTLAVALGTYQAASASQQAQWANAYARSAVKATVTGARVSLPAGNYGPVTGIVSPELVLAQSGGLDAALVAHHDFYGTDFTKPLLFLEDGGYFVSVAQAQHLQGNQWGVMNETGSYPGQPWLWLYQLWYRLPGFRSSGNVDLIAVYLTGLATLLLLLVPFIPGLRSIPRRVPVYRLIWRDYYREAEALPAPAEGPPSTGPPGSAD